MLLLRQILHISVNFCLTLKRIFSEKQALKNIDNIRYQVFQRLSKNFGKDIALTTGCKNHNPLKIREKNDE
jgi:hypothetical protein